MTLGLHETRRVCESKSSRTKHTEVHAQTHLALTHHGVLRQSRRA